jgi:pimeloyl-ACP methyl ester carboxylesterase
MRPKFVDPPQTGSPTPASTTTVVCLHGFPDTHHSWAQLTEYLSSNLPTAAVLTPHLPGYCPDAANQLPLSIDAMVIALLDYSRAKKLSAFHVVAHDWGSCIAQAFSLKYPEKVLSLTLLAIPFNFFSNVLKLGNSKQLFLSRYMCEMQAPNAQSRLMRGKLEALVDTWSPFPDKAARNALLGNVREAFGNKPVIDSAVQYYRTNIGCDSVVLKGVLLLVWVITHPVIFMFTSPLLSLLCRALYYVPIRHPADWRSDDLDVSKLPLDRVLMLGGALDGCCDVRMFETMKGKGMKVEVIDGAGHWLHIEKPGEVNGLIMKHLEAGKKSK